MNAVKNQIKKMEARVHDIAHTLAPRLLGVLFYLPGRTIPLGFEGGCGIPIGALGAGVTTVALGGTTPGRAGGGLYGRAPG